MAYIGRGLELGQHKKQDIVVTGNPNTIVDYAMDLNASQNSLLVVYGNVIQEPGTGKAYTCSGTTITFSSPPAANTPLYIIYLGQELVSVANPSTAQATAIAQNEAAALAIALGG